MIILRLLIKEIEYYRLWQQRLPLAVKGATVALGIGILNKQKKNTGEQCEKDI